MVKNHYKITEWVILTLIIKHEIIGFYDMCNQFFLAMKKFLESTGWKGYNPREINMHLNKYKQEFYKLK